MKIRAYALFYQDKETGQLIGETEHSFSMGESANEARVECETRKVKELNKFSDIKFKTANEYKAYWFKKMCDDWNNENPKSAYRKVFFRVGTKDCPVKIDWTYRILWKQKKVEWKKYKWRNLPFVQIKGLKNETV